MDIVLNCPQCGAEVGLAEDDSVFRCNYCHSVLKPTGRNEVQSFYLPPKGTKERVGAALKKALSERVGSVSIEEAYLVYAPFWRVRGLLFQWAFGRRYENTLYGGTSFDQFKRLRATSYHRTFPAFDTALLKVFSLGLRAQAMRMWPYNKTKMGDEARVLKQQISLHEAVQQALHTPYPSQGGSKEKIDILKTQLIGEAYSLIYFPYYCFSLSHGEGDGLMIVDALSHKVVKGNLSVSRLMEASLLNDTDVPYKPLAFIPFNCPNCGWELPFRPHTRIHLCRTCGMAWQETGGSFREVRYKASVKDESHLGQAAWNYLPFWKLTVAICTSQRDYRTVADFYELFPLPKVLDKEMLEKKPIHFYIPAFRIRNAQAVDKFSAQLSMNQPSFEESVAEVFRDIPAADVWLPLSEALEMAQVLLFSMTPSRAKRTLALVKDAQLRLDKRELIWLPFLEKGIFLREATTDFAIQKNCVELD